MKRESLDVYDIRPEAMNNYLRYNGRHFSKKLCEWAVAQMYTNIGPVQKITKSQIDELFKKYNITLEHNQLYDYVFVGNMCKADFYGSSIKDDEHLAKYIKDVVDDADAYDGYIFNRWYADMCGKGIAIDWEEVL